jgi:hypothetical protein
MVLTSGAVLNPIRRIDRPSLDEQATSLLQRETDEKIETEKSCDFPQNKRPALMTGWSSLCLKRYGNQ